MIVEGALSKFLATLFGQLVGKIRALSPWVRRWLNRPVIIPMTQQNHWSLGRTGDEQNIILLSTHWHLTNDSDNYVTIVNADLIWPKTKTIHSHVLLRNPDDNTYYGRLEVPPGCSTEISAHFSIKKPKLHFGQNLSISVKFTDNHGQSRILRDVAVKGIINRKKVRSKPKALEAPHRISSPIEKKVVFILKDEVERYKKCGRSSGGLGSVCRIVNGKQSKSIGSDSWTPDSPKRQNLELTDENASIVSDNLDALLNLYNGTNTEEEKKEVEGYLLNRLNFNSEYFCATYLILLFFFRLNKLNTVLQIAPATLQFQNDFISRIRKTLNPAPVEKHQRYGLSDFTRLLSGLLKFEHRNFTDNDLDMIEEFVEALPIDEFKIRERISSIHSYRLSIQTAE